MYRTGDARRSVEAWQKLGLYGKGGTDQWEVQGWLDGFVQLVGNDAAQRLLEGVGTFDYSWRTNVSNNSTSAV
eukprot:scaffold14300_cov258-Amphora_coffeaeformis.AAC.1